MRYICAITNIDRSAFLTKIIAIYLHHQRSRIREKLPFCLCRCTDPKLCLLITHKFRFCRDLFFSKDDRKSQGLSKIREKMVGHQISIVQKLSFGGSFDSAASSPWQPT